MLGVCAKHNFMLVAAAKLNVQSQTAGDHLNLETKLKLTHKIAELIRTHPGGGRLVPAM